MNHNYDWWWYHCGILWSFDVIFSWNRHRPWTYHRNSFFECLAFCRICYHDSSLSSESVPFQTEAELHQAFSLWNSFVLSKEFKSTSDISLPIPYFTNGCNIWYVLHMIYVGPLILYQVVLYFGPPYKSVPVFRAKILGVYPSDLS